MPFDLGANVFETMRAYAGKIFCLKEHLLRLEESARSIQIKLPCSRKELKQKILKELETSKLKDAYIRLSINFLGKIDILVRPPRIYPKDFYENGVKIITVPTFKDSLASVFPQAKMGNFLNGILARMEGGDFFEAILLNRAGFITEGTVSNIFVVKDKVLLTPPLYLGVLPGITRKVVMELASEMDIELKETPFTRHELYNVDEIFLTNTSIEIMPVAYVDGRKIKNNFQQKITYLLRKKFLERRLK
ncbi:MAG: aminotransferase class IV [Candidatus Omnitrophica bacterium]|nr:aminotransferase class IV [Candidatus Omnitrophota bacterium]MCM8793936.1 aminotransferase class IV [Candidatus Omnitrophota bacterium]